MVAQPRVEQSRTLARAVHAAEVFYAEGSYGRALAELEPAIDSASPGEPLADALYLQARGNFAIERYSPARAACGRFLAGYPDDHRAYEVGYLLGVALYQMGDTALAERTLSGLDEGVGQIDPWYWRARILAERGKLDAAIPLAGRSMQPTENFAAPYRTDARYLLAWMMESRGALDTAAALYRAIADDPGSELQLDARLRLGVIEARRGNAESAIRLLNSLTPRSDRQREEQMFYLGEMSSVLERYDEALRYNTEFVREFPRSPRLRQVRYGIGWALLNMVRYDEAIAAFRSLENGIDSIAAASSYQVGAIQLSKGDTASAVRTFQAMLARLPYESFSDNANYQLGRYFYRRANYDSARHYLLVAARQFPESEIRADSYYLLAESYAAMGDATNAQYNFARARRTGGAGDLYRRSLFREGLMLYRVGRFRSAIDRFREYVSEHGKGPDAGDATFWLGEALYQDHSYEEAERYYGTYLERASAGPWSESARYGLAWSRLQQKDFKGAALAFDDFTQKHPKSDLATEATIRLADCYRLMGQLDKAIATYESIGGRAGKGARDEESRFRLADVFLQMGQIDRAVETFRKLIADYPNSPLRDAYAYNIGSIYHEKEMDSLAIVELQRFVAGYPASQLLPQATFTMGDAFYNLEQYDSALAYYRRVLDQYPNSTIVPEALDAVRFTLNAVDRGAEAVAIIDSFQTRNPNRLPPDSLNFRKATIVLEGGNYPEAVTRFSRLIEEYPQSPLVPEAVFGIGRAHEYMGHRDTALAVYESVGTRFPESEAAERASIEAAGLRLRAAAWAPAGADYERFIERYPGSDRLAEARYGLAVARLALKDTATATEQLRLVLKADSAGAEEDLVLDRSRLLYARLVAARGQNDRALELLAAVVARRLDDVAAEALLARGEILFRAKDYSGALAELRRLVNDFATFPEFAEPGALLTGAVYEQLTNYSAAREIYNGLVANAENATVRAEAETRLKKLKK